MQLKIYVLIVFLALSFHFWGVPSQAQEPFRYRLDLDWTKEPDDPQPDPTPFPGPGGFDWGDAFGATGDYSVCCFKFYEYGPLSFEAGAGFGGDEDHFFVACTLDVIELCDEIFD